MTPLEEGVDAAAGEAEAADLAAPALFGEASRRRRLGSPVGHREQEYPIRRDRTAHPAARAEAESDLDHQKVCWAFRETIVSGKDSAQTPDPAAPRAAADGAGGRTRWRNLLADLSGRPDDEELLGRAVDAARDGVDDATLALLEALADESRRTEHRFLVLEARHHRGDLDGARAELKTLWKDTSHRGRFLRLGLTFLPRIQERRRFYDCESLCGIRGRHVLEIGGQLSRRFVRAAQPASWTAIDLEPTEVPGDPFYKVLQGDAAALPLPEQSASLVFSSSAFEHIDRLGEALSEMYRVLKPGGLVYSDFSPIWSSVEGHHLRGAARSALRRAGIWPLAPWAHLVLSRREMRALLGRSLSSKEVRTVERWLYRRKSLNRLFYEDYIYLFHSSPLRVVRVDRRTGEQPDAKTRRLLARRQPGRSSFHVKGMRVVLRREPPASARQPTEPLGEDELAPVEAAIRRHLDCGVVSAARFQHAGQRKVYRVQLPDRDVVLKVMDAAEPRSLGCTFAVRSLTAAGVPTPAVLGFDLDPKLFGRPYQIQESVSGLPLDRWLLEVKPARQEIAAVLGALGKHLRAMHSIPATGGYGGLDDDGVGFFSSWPEYLTGHSLIRSGKAAVRIFDMKRLRDERLLSDEEIEAIRRLFGERQDELAGQKPFLLHNDLTLKNVLLDPRRRKITALLDLHNTLGGDPLYELARFYYFYRGKGHYRQLLEGYGPLPPEALERIRLYLIYVLLEKLEWLAGREQSFPGRLERDLDTLRHTLGQFRGA